MVYFRAIFLRESAFCAETRRERRGNPCLNFGPRSPLGPGTKPSSLRKVEWRPPVFFSRRLAGTHYSGAVFTALFAGMIIGPPCDAASLTPDVFFEGRVRGIRRDSAAGSVRLNTVGLYTGFAGPVRPV